MIIFPVNFNPTSDSGPNRFTKNLFSTLDRDFNTQVSWDISQCDIEFVLIQSNFEKIKPRITRLDGIYFNISQDYNLLNEPIKRSYIQSDCVIYQSNFNKNLIEKWFGPHKNGHIIKNGANFREIKKIKKADLSNQFGNREIWSCASSWRPHKRLNENISYFLENSQADAVLLIAGKGVKKEDFYGFEKFINNRIFYIGHLSWDQLIGVYKASSTFIHLSYLDHCPNVVVDAAACGCKIICSSTGGTHEINAKEKIIIKEEEWDMSPTQLYSPPKMDFKNFVEEKNSNFKKIKESAVKYFMQMENISENS